MKISLRDSGPGIPAAILNKIFDPFFTTKNEGHGLGLAMCNSVIQRHGGCIEVESEINCGTTFHLFIPADTHSHQQIRSEEVSVHSGKGTVYVMDDEEVMRTAISNVLLSMGYTVIACKNGEAIIENFIKAEITLNVRAFLFDLTIKGGIGGLETLKKIREHNTTIPIFVTSGYSEDPIMANPQKYGFIASIKKPFRKSELIEVLNRFLSTEL